MIISHKDRLFLIFMVLLLASLACNFGRRGSQSPSESVPVTPESLQNPQANSQTPGHVSFTVDEAELTSLITSELQTQQDKILQDPKVSLSDGQLKLTGKVNQAGITADLMMTMTISATQDGRLSSQLVSAQLGPFPLPQNFMDSVSQQLNSVFNNDINPRFENVFIESVTIANGQMVLQGHPR